MVIKCSTGEIVYSYKDYLKTTHWKNKRAAIRKKFNNQCVNCKTSNGLEVHHKTYKNIGKELLYELTLLCRNCHQRSNDNSNSSQQLKEDLHDRRSKSFEYIKDKYKVDSIKDFKFFVKRREQLIKVDNYYIMLSRSMKVFKVYNSSKELIEKITVKRASTKAF